MIYSLLRTIINMVNAAPRVIMMIAVTFFFLSTSCGMMGWLALSNFFNIFMFFFFSIAAAAALLGLAKLATWRLGSSQQAKSHGSVLLILHHILNVQTLEHHMLNARETTTTLVRQPVLVTALPTESRLVPITCSTCQQKVTLRVDSLQERQRVRLRHVLLATLSLVAMLALELGIYLLTRGHGNEYNPIGYVHVVSLALLFISLFSFLRLLKYVGVTLTGASAGHDLVHPASLEEFRMQANLQAQ